LHGSPRFDRLHNIAAGAVINAENIQLNPYGEIAETR
jgi:hypothetical protein